MTMTRRELGTRVGVIVGALALVPALATGARAQAAKLIDANKATEGELQQLPNMTPATAKAIVAKRPFKTVVDLNKVLLDQKLTAAQARDFLSQGVHPDQFEHRHEGRIPFNSRRRAA